MMFGNAKPKEIVILDLLRNGVERYGLEMVNESRGALRRGTIYVTLNRMVEKGLISSRKEQSIETKGNALRLYRITGQGVTALSAWEAGEEIYRAGVIHA